MEADKFDRLMAEKLGRADAPQYSETKWASLHSKLPSSGFGVSWTNIGLIVLLGLSNAWWIWNSNGHQNEPAASKVPVYTSAKGGLVNENDPAVDRRTVIAYDTIHKVVEVVVYAHAETENTPVNGYKNAGYDAGENPNAAYKSDDRKIASVAVSESVPVEMSGEMQLGDPGHNAPVAVTDSLTSGDEKPGESIAGETTEVEEKKQKSPYDGPRWFVGLNGQKPFGAAGKQKALSGNGIGINVEYVPAEGLTVIGELNLLNYDYVIEDKAFYEKVRESSDPDVYGPGGVYGSGYSWQHSEVNKSSTQAGVFFKLSHPASPSRIRPFVSSGYVIELSTEMDVTNKLIESGTNKVVRVESLMPGDHQSQYIRSEIGVESQLNHLFWLRLSANHWMQVTGSPYEGDWIGGKMVVVYQLD